MKKPIKIVIVDDHQLVRFTLKWKLEEESELSVVGEAEDGIMAMEQVAELKPDLVIMDITMPNLNGIEATRRIKENLPEIKVVAFSMHADQNHVVEMLKAGADGYLHKDSAFEELMPCVKSVMKGQVYLSPRITGTIIQDYLANKVKGVTVYTLLTSREREVLQLLAEGRSTKETAALLFLSAKTVETHRKHIMEKLDIDNLAELVKYAIREGLTSPEI